GGGGGWFGGAGMNGVGAGGGGSGYVLTKDSYKPTGYTPTSEYYFDNVVMTLVEILLVLMVMLK
ncbi:glycine rich family protein, partial [Clostridioides difficile CD86]